MIRVLVALAVLGVSPLMSSQMGIHEAEPAQPPWRSQLDLSMMRHAYEWHSTEPDAGWMMVRVHADERTRYHIQFGGATTREDARVTWSGAGGIRATEGAWAQLGGTIGGGGVDTSCRDIADEQGLEDCPRRAFVRDGDRSSGTGTWDPGDHIALIFDAGATGSFWIRLETDHPVQPLWQDEGPSTMHVLTPERGSIGAVEMTADFEAPTPWLAIFRGLDAFEGAAFNLSGPTGEAIEIDAWGDFWPDAVSGRAGPWTVTARGERTDAEPSAAALVGLLFGFDMVKADGTMGPYGTFLERGPPPSGTARHAPP